MEKIKLTAPRYVACNSKNQVTVFLTQKTSIYAIFTQIIVTDTSEKCVIAFDRDGSVIFRIGSPTSTVLDQPDELHLIKEGKITEA